MQRAGVEEMLQSSACYLKDRLYFFSPVDQRITPGSFEGDKYHLFNVDATLTYEPFYADFGPLNLGMLYKFCRTLSAKLHSEMHKNKTIVFYTYHWPQNRANGAYLIAAYAVLYLNFTPQQAVAPLANQREFIPFRDASMASYCTYKLTVEHCCQALEKAKKLKWLDFDTFDVEDYEFYECPENGDFNILIPGRFLAFSGPQASNRSLDGYPSFTPEDYVPIFHQRGVKTVIRLNKRVYDKQKFVENGIKHYDFFFIDGTTPSTVLLDRFIAACEESPGLIAVHCKAGLGRTGTTIGCYMMKHYQFTAEEAIAWLRICRPGSVIGPQQQFMKMMEPKMWKAGQEMRKAQQKLNSTSGGASSSSSGGGSQSSLSPPVEEEKKSSAMSSPMSLSAKTPIKRKVQKKKILSATPSVARRPRHQIGSPASPSMVPGVGKSKARTGYGNRSADSSPNVLRSAQLSHSRTGSESSLRLSGSFAGSRSLSGVGRKRVNQIKSKSAHMDLSYSLPSVVLRKRLDRAAKSRIKKAESKSSSPPPTKLPTTSPYRSSSASSLDVTGQNATTLAAQRNTEVGTNQGDRLRLLKAKKRRNKATNSPTSNMNGSPSSSPST